MRNNSKLSESMKSRNYYLDSTRLFDSEPLSIAPALPPVLLRLIIILPSQQGTLFKSQTFIGTAHSRTYENSTELISLFYFFLFSLLRQ